MEKFKQKAPAIWRIFFQSPPFVIIDRLGGCADCPFAEINQQEDRPNQYDPDEGYYNCTLLGREHIWGESPVCEDSDWQNQIAKEIEDIAEFEIEQEIIHKKANELLYLFSVALRDEDNDNLTVAQIKKKLFEGVSSTVISVFDEKLRNMSDSH